MKEQILQLLKQNKNSFISGEKISDILGITRAAVWKHMKLIKEEGYEIESVSRKGYKLISSPDLLIYDEIKSGLNTKYIGKKFIYMDSIDSTNNEAKKLASLGAIDGTVVVCEEQTSGRGRLGRRWISPKFKGIWMSIILRPDMVPMNVPKITQVTAAAVNSAIRSLGIKSYIKWPNDIILNGKKVCGILTEMSGEINKVNHLVVGIGINVNMDISEIPSELKDIATSFKIELGHNVNRKDIVCAILNNFEELYEELVREGHMKTSIEICKENSILIGKPIRIIDKFKETNAKAIGLSEDGRLIVQYEDGKYDYIMSGEVSIRGIEGYV